MKSVLETALENFMMAPETRQLLTVLVSEEPAGMSYSQLKEITNISTGSLAKHLRTLQRGGLIENYLQRAENSKEYSFYRVTRLGEILLNEFDVFTRAVERQIELSSSVPGIAPRRKVSSLFRSAEEIFASLIGFEGELLQRGYLARPELGQTRELTGRRRKGVPHWMEHEEPHEPWSQDWLKA